MDDLDPRITDPEWRLSHLYKIVDKQGRLRVFKRNKAQAHFALVRALRNIILKARQLGFTTDACLEMLDTAIFRKNFNGVIIAHDLESLERIFNKIKVAWDHFDEDLRQAIGVSAIKQNTSEIQFNNGSRLSVSLSSRSDTVHWLHVSEFGKICAKYPLKAAEIITGALPSVPPDGRITIESTAEGEEGKFYEMFWEAFERGEPQNSLQYKAFFFPWVQDPNYTLEDSEPLPEEMRLYQKRYKLTDGQIHWYFEQKKVLKKLMPQEYPTTPEEAFLSSGRKVLDMDTIARHMENMKQKFADGTWPQPQTVGNWTYFLPFKKKHRYGMGVDVSEGIGLDSSTAVIIDFTPDIPVQVARFMSKEVSPEALPFELLIGARAYGNPLMSIERNNHGRATLAIMRDLYFNLYSEVRKDRLTDKDTNVLGFLTTNASKPRIVFNLKAALEDDEFETPDEILLREARKFDQTDLAVVKLDPETTRHFDVFMAACIAYELKDHVGGTGEVHVVEEPLRNPHSVMQ